jgi:hypothetical protein
MPDGGKAMGKLHGVPELPPHYLSREKDLTGLKKNYSPANNFLFQPSEIRLTRKIVWRQLGYAKKSTI